MEAEQLGYLSRINLFADLDRATLATLNGITPMVTVPRGSVILRPGEAAQVLYLLKRGRVRLYRLTPDGRELTLAILGDGNVFGATETVALGSPEMYAKAMDDALVCAMRQGDVERLLRAHPEVALRLVSLLSQRVCELESLVESLAHEDVRQRLLHLLLHLAGDFGVEETDGFTRLDLPLTHEDLATMIGSTRETVTVTLSRLVRENVVRTGRREIALHRRRAQACLQPERPADPGGGGSTA